MTPLTPSKIGCKPSVYRGFSTLTPSNGKIYIWKKLKNSQAWRNCRLSLPSVRPQYNRPTSHKGNFLPTGNSIESARIYESGMSAI